MSTNFRPGVEFYYENGVRNYQIAPRYKGIEHTYLMRHQYLQSSYLVIDFELLSGIFILLNLTMQMASEIIK